MDIIISISIILSVALIVIINICFFVNFDFYCDTQPSRMYPFFAVQGLFVVAMCGDSVAFVSAVLLLLISDAGIYAKVQKAERKFQSEIAEINRKFNADVAQEV